MLAISNSDIILPQMIDTKDFLPKEEYEFIKARCPIEGWQDAVVFNKHSRANVYNPRVRNMKKIVERDTSLIDIVLPKIMSVLNTFDGFIDAWIRPGHIEWLCYERGMFFDVHEDFERYTCNGMRPYVFLLGLSNTEEGGCTIVNDKKLFGGTVENGAILFQSNVPHSSEMVLTGKKICLKMEIMALFSDVEMMRVQTPDGNISSYWDMEALRHIDNYMSSSLRFQASRENKIIVSEDLACDIKDAMIAITMSRDHFTNDMIFPSMTTSCVRDVFVCCGLRHTSGVVMCSDPLAWQLVNESSIFNGVTLVVGLWVKKTNTYGVSPYKLNTILDRRGNPISVSDTPDDGSYITLDSLRSRLIRKFIQSMESDMQKPKLVSEIKNGAPHVSSWPSHKIFNEITKHSPSDEFVEASVAEGEVEHVDREWCNDEESGFEEVHYTAYESYKMQIRWCVLKGID